jgi:hypothetical protein
MTVDALPEGPPIDAYTILYDNQGGPNLIYQGWARAQLNASTAAGQASNVWVIRKNTYEADIGGSPLTMQQWSNGDTSKMVVWNNRATTVVYQ